jgi:hypothetical protein
VHEILRDAIAGAIGVTVKFRVSVEGTATTPITQPVAAAPAPVQASASAPKSSGKREFATPEPQDSAPAKVASDDGWDVVAIPGSASDEAPATVLPDEPAPEAEPQSIAHTPAYGEAVVRSVLGATFLSEEKTGEIDIVTEAEVMFDAPLAMLDEVPPPIEDER